MTKLDTLSENFHGLRNYAQDSFLSIQAKIREVENRGAARDGCLGPGLICRVFRIQTTD
jgi:hypothetical protein